MFGSKKETTAPLSTLRLKVLEPIFEEQIRIYNAKRLWVFHEKPSKHLTVFSPETVNIKKLANLTANTKNYRQITLNTEPHSDPRVWIISLDILRSKTISLSRALFSFPFVYSILFYLFLVEWGPGERSIRIQS